MLYQRELWFRYALKSLKNLKWISAIARTRKLGRYLSYTKAINLDLLYRRVWRRAYLRAVVPIAFVLLSAKLPIQAQSSTQINLATQAYNADFANFPATRPVSVGAQLPGICGVGQLFFGIPAINGSFLWLCTSPDTWNPMAKAAPTSTTNRSTQITKSDSSARRPEGDGFVALPPLSLPGVRSSLHVQPLRGYRTNK